jgi:NAD(P)-dependent dehydrogenase (short-subunit alcohol dehydrogenase family)
MKSLKQKLALLDLTGKNSRTKIAVYGASGHTGRFVVAELLRRKRTVVAIARNASTLAFASAKPGNQISQDLTHSEKRIAALDDPDALDHALADVRVVINCAGPFLDTAEAVIASALRMRVHYLDVTAEQQSARDTLERHHQGAQAAGVKVIPAAGFFGGLAELMVRSIMGDWSLAEHVRVDITLDSWQPTLGTRLTGARNTAPRVVLSNRELVALQPDMMPSPLARSQHTGHAMAEVPLSEMIAFARDRRIANARSYLNVSALAQLSNPKTSPPIASDALGRSAQRFQVDVQLQNGVEQRRLSVSGQDIYAVTAPIVVEAVERLFELDACRLTGETCTLGELFARDFVAVSPDRRDFVAVSPDRPDMFCQGKTRTAHFLARIASCYPGFVVHS